MKGQKGAALPLAIMALAFGTLVITPFLSHASSAIIGSGVYAQGLSERYAADAGIEYAIWGLMSQTLVVPEGATTPLPAMSLNNKAVSVSVQNQGSDTYLITATALSGDGHSTAIESLVQAGGGGDYYPGDINVGYYQTYSGDALADGNIFLNSNSRITGGAYATGDITMVWDSDIYGDAAAGGDIFLNSLAVIGGSASAGGAITLDWLARISGDAVAGGALTLYTQTQIWGSAVSGGNVYLGSNARINGDLYITASGHNLVMDSQAWVGNVYISGDVNNVWLGYQTRINGGLYITGAITGTLQMGYQASIAGGIHQHYSGSFPPTPDGPSLPAGGDNIVILSWN